MGNLKRNGPPTDHHQNFGPTKWSGPNFFHIKYDLKILLDCIFRQFREHFFEKDPLFYLHFKKAIFEYKNIKVKKLVVFLPGQLEE